MTMREHLRPATLPNVKSPWASSAAEREDRQAAGEAYLAVLRSQLPDLLSRFSRIRDPRRPGSVRHQITVLGVWRAAVRLWHGVPPRGRRPDLWEALQLAFPELDSVLRVTLSTW